MLSKSVIRHTENEWGYDVQIVSTGIGCDVLNMFVGFPFMIPYSGYEPLWETYYLHLQGTNKHDLITQNTAVWIIYTSTKENKMSEENLINYFIYFRIIWGWNFVFSWIFTAVKTYFSYGSKLQIFLILELILSLVKLISLSSENCLQKSSAFWDIPVCRLAHHYRLRQRCS